MQGASLFIKFKKYDLYTQHRSTDDTQTDNVMSMRDVTNKQPITIPLLKSYKQLNPIKYYTLYYHV